MPTRHVPIPSPAVISGRVDPATEKRMAKHEWRQA